MVADATLVVGTEKGATGIPCAIVHGALEPRLRKASDLLVLVGTAL